MSFPSSSFQKSSSNVVTRTNLSTTTFQAEGDDKQHDPDSTASVLPSAHKDVIQQTFGPDVDLYRDVFRLSRERFSEQQLRIAYFKRGREFLKEQRQTKNSRIAKKQFQAITMAFEILSKPDWKSCYDSVGFGVESNVQSDTWKVSEEAGCGLFHDDNLSKADQSFGGLTLLSNSSLGSGPILRRSSSWGGDRNRSSRSTGTRLRWNEHVEELVFKEDPEERRFKSSSRDFRSNDDEENEGYEDRHFQDHCDDGAELQRTKKGFNQAPLHRVVKIKRKRQKSDQKKCKDNFVDKITKELEDLDQHFENESQNFANDLLDEIEIGLRGLGKKIGGFIRSSSTNKSPTKDNSEVSFPIVYEKNGEYQFQSPRPDAATYIPDNSILTTEDLDNLNFNTNNAQLNSNVVTPDQDHSRLDGNESYDENVKASANELDDLNVRELFKDLMRKPSFDTTNPKKSQAIEKTKDHSKDKQNVNIVLRTEKQSGIQSTENMMTIDDKQETTNRSSFDGLNPFGNLFSIAKSAKKERSVTISRQNAKKPVKTSELIELAEIGHGGSDKKYNPTGLVIKAKVKNHIPTVYNDTSSVCDDSISVLTPGTAKVWHQHSVSGQETILDEDDSKDFDEDDPFNHFPGWTAERECNLSKQHGSGIDECKDPDWLLRTGTMSIGSMLRDAEFTEDYGSVATGMIEQNMDDPRIDFCQGIVRGIVTSTAHSRNGTSAKLSTDQNRNCQMEDPSNDDKDFITYVNSCVKSVMTDVSKLSNQFNSNVEEARKAMERTIGISDDGGNQREEVVAKVRQPSARRRQHSSTKEFEQAFSY